MARSDLPGSGFALGLGRPVRRWLTAIGGALLMSAGPTWAAEPMSKATEHKADEKAPQKMAAEKVAAGEGAKAAPHEISPAKVAPSSNEKGSEKASAKPGDAPADKVVDGGKKIAPVAEKLLPASGSASREKGKEPASSARKKPTQPTGDEEATSPPLDINGLRAEVRRQAPPPSGVDSPEMPETKVEKMLADVAKAREALHEDTQKLEALMAQDNQKAEALLAQENVPAAEAGAGASGGPGGAGKSAAKNPLDILAKALRGIKPDQSAPIVSRLDRHLGAVVLQRMPPVDAGKILGAMKPETAAELATLIAMRRPSAETRAEAKR